MKDFKSKLVTTLLLIAAPVFATTWYLGWLVPGSYAMDQDNAYSNAANYFKMHQGTMGKMQPGDLVDVEYEDGAIMQYTLGRDATDCGLKCVWADVPFNDQAPKRLQGPWPGSAKPKKVSVTEGSPLNLIMSTAPTLDTPVWTISIVQYGGGCDLCSSMTSGGSVGGGGGDGGGGGGDGGGGGGCSGDECTHTPRDGEDDN